MQLRSTVSCRCCSLSESWVKKTVPPSGSRQRTSAVWGPTVSPSTTPCREGAVKSHPFEEELRQKATSTPSTMSCSWTAMSGDAACTRDKLASTSADEYLGRVDDQGWAGISKL